MFTQGYLYSFPKYKDTCGPMKAFERQFNTMVLCFVTVAYRAYMYSLTCPPTKYLDERVNVTNLSIPAHPKVDLFITHGDTQSVYEAVYHGVPVVGISLVGDQTHLLRKLETEGAGLVLKYATMTKLDIVKGVTSVLEDPRYDICVICHS